MCVSLRVLSNFPSSFTIQLQVSSQFMWPQLKMLWISPVSHWSIMNSLMSLVNPRHLLCCLTMNLKIKLEERTIPLLDENISTGLICPTSSLHTTLVLFVKKKNGSLHLCIDHWGLNKLTKKDCYPLPLISDLLNSQSHAKVYIKIDLWHAYHLVQITLRDE